MESFPLNKAHQLDRRAEAFLKQKKFDESIECHKGAIKHLHEAGQLTENSRSRESIQMQIDSHQKQVQSLKVKKLQYDDFRRYQDSFKHRLVNLDGVCENGESLQHEIIRTMETHDSLIEVLMKRNCDDESLKSYTSDEEKTPSGDTCDGLNITGRRRQVDDSVLLEEFKGLSEKLRELVEILMARIEDKDNEIEKLREEVHRLECEKNKDNAKTNNTLKVITDSSGATSPYVFSPCSELSPEVNEIKGLPSLAPLEMPNFDFSSIVKNTKNLNISTEGNNN